jgi:hypothetical protein
MYRAFRVMWLFLLVAPVASAQTAGGEAPVPAPAPAAPAPVDPTVLQKSTISGEEMLSQGREYRQQIQSITMQIQVQSEQAKADKDVIRLNCLLDKLTQVKVNGTMMDQALQSLQECVSRRDESAQLHEYTRVTIINQKVQVLRTEADACVGAETNYVGPTKVVVESPAGLTATIDQPPAVAPPFSVIDRPPVASPYNTPAQP